MQQLDFSNIELSFYEKWILRLIPILKSSLFFKKSSLDTLRSYGMIKISGYGKLKQTYYKRMNPGKMYLRIKRKDSLRFLIPTTISIIALLESYDILTIPLLAEILREVSSILKNIMEILGIGT